MANIFCKSPFFVRINQTGQIETKVELRIWNGTGSAPTSPTYTLSKLIPSAAKPETFYNISSYVQEFINHDTYQNNYNVINQAWTNTEWCNVEVKTFYKTNSSPSFVAGTTTTYKSFDGRSFYTEGYNEDLGDTLLPQGTYYYHYDSAANLAGEPLKRAGSISRVGAAGDYVKYSELGTSNTYIPGGTFNGGVINIFRVYVNYMAKGNKVEIFDSSNVLKWTGTFKPITECRYEPVVVDFINRYGAWQREFFFKASKNEISVTTSNYNLLQNTLFNFSTTEGQRKNFNMVMLETITVNSDWRDDFFAETIRSLMMSERILVNNKPARLLTQNTELFKQVNTKMINYQLQFEFAYDINNTVV